MCKVIYCVWPFLANIFTFSSGFFQIFKHLLPKSRMRGKLLSSLKSTVKFSWALGISNLSDDIYTYRKKLIHFHPLKSSDTLSCIKLKLIYGYPHLPWVAVFKGTEDTRLSLFDHEIFPFPFLLLSGQRTWQDSALYSKSTQTLFAGSKAQND